MLLRTEFVHWIHSYQLLKFLFSSSPYGILRIKKMKHSVNIGKLITASLLFSSNATNNFSFYCVLSLQVTVFHVITEVEAFRNAKMSGMHLKGHVHLKRRLPKRLPFLGPHSTCCFFLFHLYPTGYKTKYRKTLHWSNDSKPRNGC